MKRTISITLDEEIIKKLDSIKEFCPRSTYINHILKVFLKIKTEKELLHGLNRLLEK